MNPNIRPPAVAGLFYSDKKMELDREVAVYLENAPQIEINGRVIGMVAPHAGYMYSGGVAARAYRQLLDLDIDVVAVIAPSHREYFTEISIFDGFAYATPLGTIEIHRGLAQELADINPQIILSEKGHRFEEHALEVQLPFLQKVLVKFKLIPIIMGEHSSDNIETLAQALATTLRDQKALIVASSDLSHFYNAAKAETMDHLVRDKISGFAEDELFNELRAGKCEMCGGGPVVACMKASKLLGADKSKTLLYRHSGDITGDRSEVVGYLSALFYQEKD
jgi:AmmeMemoRadiSam system protein B